MNKANVKPAAKLLMLSPKVVLDFDTFWALQFSRDQGTYLEYTRDLIPLFNVKFKDPNELQTKIFNFMCGEVK